VRERNDVWRVLGRDPGPEGRLVVGLMTGTSADAVDAALVRFHGAGLDARHELLAYRETQFDDTLRREVLELSGASALAPERLMRLDAALGERYAEVTHELLRSAGVTPREVAAIGSHGQTVRHRPGDGDGYTWQLNQPAWLAEHTGIDVIADFRSRDMAAGGQGAPLVPAFHAAAFGGAGRARALLNVGGIANLTLLPADAAGLRGFDCGPGNVLMDLWSRRCRGLPYDDAGQWAASGQVLAPLLDLLLAEPYFALPPPKSTGRDLFHAAWLDARLRRLDGPAPAANDVQSTLLELTARGAIDALRACAAGTEELLVCGGGAFNATLMRRLAALWPGLDVASTARAGLPPMQVEAAAFAWLAQRFCDRLPGNHPGVTGARGGRILGALYPA